MQQSRNILFLTLFCLLFSIACSRSVEDGDNSSRPHSSSKYIYKFPPIDPRFDSIANLIGNNEFNRTPGPADIQNAALLSRIGAESGNPQLKARAAYWNVRVQQTLLPPDSCIQLLDNALSISDDDAHYDNALISYLIAGNYERLGHYFNTYQLIEKIIPVLEEAEDNYFLGNTYLLMALTYKEINEIALANEQLDLAQKHYSLAGYPLNRIYFFKANINPDLPFAEKAKFYTQSIREGDNDPGMTIQALVNMSELHLLNKDFAKAQEYLDAAAKLQEEKMKGNLIFQAMVLSHKGSLDLSLQEYDKAMEHFSQLESILKKFPNEEWEAPMYLSMSKVYEEKGNQGMAFEYLKKYQKAFAQQMSQVKSSEIPNARAREAIARQKDTIRIQEQQISRHRTFIWIAGLITLVVLTATFFVIKYLRQGKKLKETEARELRTNLEQEMALARFNRESFENDIQKKDCEISSAVLLLANKNDVLKQISDISKKYADSGQISNEYTKAVNEIIKDSIENDDEWSRFKIHFDSVHPSFFTTLKDNYPDLTENDLRLCAYIRIGMRAKEIAEMLMVSVASVNSNRYRIRKKLNLPKEASLDEFIRKIK